MTPNEQKIAMAEARGEVIGRSWVRWIVKDPNGNLVKETDDMRLNKVDFADLVPEYQNEPNA